MVSDTVHCHRCRLLYFDPFSLIYDQAQECYLFIPLHYALDDEFPSLPILTISADSGCLICDFLKKAIWSHCWSDPALSEACRSNVKSAKGHPNKVTNNLRLVLSEYHPVGKQLFADKRKAEPLWICGHISLKGIESAIEINVMDDEVGKIIQKVCMPVCRLI